MTAKFAIEYEVEQTANPMRFEMESSALGFSATEEELVRMYESYILSHFKERLKLKGKNRDKFLTWAKNEVRSHQPSFAIKLRRELSRFDLIEATEIGLVVDILSKLELIKDVNVRIEKFDQYLLVVAEAGFAAFHFKLLDSETFYEHIYKVSVFGQTGVSVVNEKAENDFWQILQKSVIIFTEEVGKN